MKKLVKIVFGMIFLPSGFAFAGDYLQNGVYATYSRYCGLQLSFKESTQTLVATGVKNPYYSEGCRDAGKVFIYDHYGAINLGSGRIVNAYYQLCGGAATVWCNAIEAVTSREFIEYVNGGNAITYFLY